MRLITQAELRAMLLTQTASAMVSIVCATTPKMNKTGNPFIIGKGKASVTTICKANKANGNIASRYEKMVENRHAKAIQAERAAAGQPPATAAEVEAIVAERFRKGTSWHRPILDADNAPTCLSVNKSDDNDNGAAYLRFVFKAKGKAEYFDITTGDVVADDRVNPFLSERSDYANQGLDGNEVIFVCYSLDSILEIAIDGERFRISDNFTAYPIDTRTKLWDVAEAYIEGEKKMAQV